MKWLIASDIHGSSSSCRMLMDAFEKEKADKMLLLGDILYHGPRNNLPGEYDPKQVIAMLNSIKEKIVCVRGNCDAEVDQMVLEFPIMADYNYINEGGKMIFATHGHIYGPNHVPPLGNIDVLLCGHTHVPACEKIEGGLYCNPGSTSIPKGGSKFSYMTLEDGVMLWKYLETGEIYNRYEL